LFELERRQFTSTTKPTKIRQSFKWFMNVDGGSLQIVPHSAQFRLEAGVARRLRSIEEGVEVIFQAAVNARL